MLPTELHTRVVYENWLRGEFGTPDDPKARAVRPAAARTRRRGPATTWSPATTRTTRPRPRRRAEYDKIYNDLGAAQGYFAGTEGSRTGAGFLGFFQSIVYSLFQFLAKLAVLLAQLLLRIFTLAAPVIGLVALVHHDILRKVGRAVGAVVLNVLILAMLAGIHFKFLQLIFGPDVQLSMLTQMLLAGIVTLVFLLVGRPMKRMWQMVELSVGAVGASVPSGGGGCSPGSAGARARRRSVARRTSSGTSCATRSWPATPWPPRPGGGRRPRPEATGPVMATAERLDTRRPIAGGGTFALSAGGRGPAGELDPAMVPSGPGGRSGPAGALMDRAPSRVVDTAPVADRGWGDWGEDAMIVPSQVPSRRVESTGRYEPTPVAAPRSAPRAADVEMIAGRPVHVVYRPSRGLEVREQTPRRMPLRDGPRETDAVVR